MKKALTTLGVAAGVFAGAKALQRLTASSFEGRTVVITGGSRGLGLTLARTFGAEGARLVLAARSEEDLDDAQRELESEGIAVLTIAVDLRSADGAEELVRRAAERFGDIDVIVNNAGTIQVGPVEHMNDDDFRTAMDVHFWSAHHITQAALPFLRESDMARIVNIASIGGEVSIPHMAPYVASKSALVGYSDTLRAELIGDGIRVTTVSPGLMRTGSHANALFKGRRETEYAWFSIMQGLPLFSTSAESAARKIVNACRYGQPHLAVTLPAKIAIAADALMPNVASRLRDTVGLVLPAPREERGDQPRKGRSVTGKAPKPLTHIADKEAPTHNEGEAPR